MTRALMALIALTALCDGAAAQTVRIGVHAVGVSHAEVEKDLRVNGAGLGGLVSVRLGRFGLDLAGHAARLDAAPDGIQEFDLLQGDARLSFAIARSIAIEIGVGRRRIDPEFAAQDVGVGRVGILSEVPVGNLGRFWGRGAYLVNPAFSGGGTAGLAVELGLGAALGTANGRFRVRVEYEFQRIDREVAAAKVPIQMTVAKLGLDVGF